MWNWIWNWSSKVHKRKNYDHLTILLKIGRYFIVKIQKKYILNISDQLESSFEQREAKNWLFLQFLNEKLNVKLNVKLKFKSSAEKELVPLTLTLKTSRYFWMKTQKNLNSENLTTCSRVLSSQKQRMDYICNFKMWNWM